MKILSICPSIYPHKLDKMLNTFDLTSSKYNSIVIITEVKPITKIFNEIFNKYPDYDYYHLQNDDILYKTPLWDTELSNKNKISYGDDFIQGKNHPTFPMIDGDIVRALGWLQMPTLNRYYGDTIWKFIGQQLDILNYVPSVKIEHKWEESQVDMEIYKQDKGEFAKWLPWAFRDINKIRNILC